MTMGHTEQAHCAGNVLNFSECKDIELNNMELYGCGVYGIGAYSGNAVLPALTEAVTTETWYYDKNVYKENCIWREAALCPDLSH